MTRILPAHAEDSLEQAARLLRDGAVIGVPTETVYGLAANAYDAQAIATVFALKQRPGFNPLIIHCASADQAFAHAQATPLARRLADQFWPGPVSLVLSRTNLDDSAPVKPVYDAACAGLDSIALRVPAHQALQALLARLDMPLAAPSANPSGRLSPVCAQHVAQDFAGRIPCVLDGGVCAYGLESSIIDARGDTPLLLRPGAVTREQLSISSSDSKHEDSPESPRSPGQSLRHYAPKSRLRLNAQTPRSGEAYLAFGPAPRHDGPMQNLSETANLAEAASRLFAMLRELDGQAACIAIAPIPEHGLGETINDRLRRGAAS